MAEVDSGLEQLPHGDGRHDGRPPVGWFLRGPSLIPGTGRSSAGTARWERSACVLRSAVADGRSRDRSARLWPGPARSVAQGPFGPGRRSGRHVEPGAASEGGSVMPHGRLPFAVCLARRRRGRTARVAAVRASRPGRRPRSRSPYVARRRCVRFRWSTVSSGRPKPRDFRQRTSTITSAAGGPGSTATRSSSWRPTWTFLARMVQPAARSGPGPAIRRSHLPAEQRSESARRSGHPSAMMRTAARRRRIAG